MMVEPVTFSVIPHKSQYSAQRTLSLGVDCSEMSTLNVGATAAIENCIFVVFIYVYTLDRF